MVGSIIRFAGQFHFQMPEANNDPAFVLPPFDPQATLEDILPITGADPADYFRFTFRDCSVRSAVEEGGRVLAFNTEDPVVGSTLDLDAFMVDISPSAICAVIHAGRFQLGPLGGGIIEAAVQSDLRLNVRPAGFDDVTAAAHYSTGAQLERTSGQSALLERLAASGDLEFGFHLNRFRKAIDGDGNPIPNGLTGDVYGYIRPKLERKASDGLRLANRRLVAHPGLGSNPVIEELFLTRIGSEVKASVPRIMDIDGFYDVSSAGDWFFLRTLDFVPFLDFVYTTPTSAGMVSGYVVYASDQGREVEVGRFRGDHEEMLATGGIHVFHSPGGISTTNRLAVDVLDASGARHPLMIESEWDLELLGDRGMTLGSLEEAQVSAAVTRHNRPAQGVAAAIRVANDQRSPTVADIESLGAPTSDADGLLSYAVRARNLSDLGGIEDPVTGQPVHEAPSDRQYGSKAFIAIPNPLRRNLTTIEEVELCIRVLPKVDIAALPAPVSFARDVAPLLGYYIRFFPWLHTRRSGTGYRRFLDLSDYDSVASNVDEIVTRLELPSEDHRKMPRSRDAPVGLSALFRRWRDEGLNP